MYAEIQWPTPHWNCLGLVSRARLSRGERVRSNSHHHLISMLFREWCALGVLTEDLPCRNVFQFMFTPTSLGALLLSMQYKSLMGIWPDSLLPSESLACKTRLGLVSWSQTLTCFSCDWESGFVRLGWVYLAGQHWSHYHTSLTKREAGFKRVGHQNAYCKQTRPHHIISLIPSTVFFPLKVLSIALTWLLQTVVQSWESGRRIQSSLFGHVWVWQRKVVQSRSHSCIVVIGGMGEGATWASSRTWAFQFLPATNWELSKDTKWWVLVSYLSVELNNIFKGNEAGAGWSLQLNWGYPRSFYWKRETLC